MTRTFMSESIRRPDDWAGWHAIILAKEEARRILAETERSPRCDIISGHHPTNANRGLGHALWQEANSALAESLANALAEWPESDPNDDRLE